MEDRLKNRLLLPLISAIALLSLGGCDSYLYEQSRPIESGAWSYADTVAFEFDIPDTAGRYDVFLEVEHDDDFRFENLYAMLHVGFPDGNSRQEQVSLELAEKTGKWLGRCSRGRCTRRLSFMPNARFELPGKHTIRLVQYSRQEQMPGIRGLALKIQRRKSEG